MLFRSLLFLFYRGFTIAVYIIILFGNIETTNITDKTEFMEIRNMSTPVQRNASVTSKTEELILIIIRTQQLYNRVPNTPPGLPMILRISILRSSLSSIRSSLFVTPPYISEG